MSFPFVHKVEAIVIAIFLAAAAEGAPQPRLVYPRLLQERSTDDAKLVHIHEELTLSLVKESVAAPTLIVREFENGMPTVRFIRGEDIDGNLYEDDKRFATVLVGAASGVLELDGVIGPRHRIAPAPMMERSEEGHLPHLIYEIEEEEGAEYDALFFKEGRRKRKRKRTYKSNKKVPVEVTIELFIISDKKHQKYFKKSETLLRYLCSMVNSANMRYKDTVAPRVKLLLVGLERSQGTEPYFHGHYEHMDPTVTRRKLTNYVVLKKRKLGYPDAVYLITGRDMYSMENGVPDTGVKDEAENFE